MKKIILLVGAFVVTMGTISAQAPFWTETFGAGIPAGWINQGSDMNGGAHTGMWMYTKTGNHGGFSSNEALVSPTAANGWIKFDSDSLDNAGTQTEGAGGCPAPQRGYLTTTAINCTGHTNVLLQFYSVYFSYAGNPRIVVSNGTVTDTFDVDENYDFTFGKTPNPVFTQYDISSVAANSAAVTITFLWDAGLYYWWQLDDVSLLDAPANDIQIAGNNNFPILDGSYLYNSTPLVEMDSISYYAYAVSVGPDDQYDARVSLKITQGATTVFSDTSPLGITLPYGIDSPLTGTNSYLPTAIGNYTSYINVFSDSTNGLPYQAGDTSSFAVSDSVFAVDNGVYGGSFFVYLPASESTTGVAGQNELASIYYLPVSDTVTSITAAFDNVFSTVGSVVQANVYSLPATYDGFSSTGYSCTPVIQTEQKMLTAADLPGGGYGAIRPVTFQISNSTGAADAAVLAPGFYAVSITNVNDSAVALVNGFDGTGAFGTPGGIISSGVLAAYSNTHFYLRMNLGHNFNLLQASFTRTPNTATIPTYHPVTFFGSTNNTGDANTIYNWTMQSSDSAYTVAFNSYTIKNLIDTPSIPDSVYVCLTVQDHGQSAKTCKYVVVRANTGIDEISALSQVNLMPNPTTGNVTISAQNATGTLSVTIVNLLGEVVKNYNEDANGDFSKTYNLSDLSSGIYLVKIENAGTTVTKKLSIAKQ